MEAVEREARRKATEEMAQQIKDYYEPHRCLVILHSDGYIEARGRNHVQVMFIEMPKLVRGVQSSVANQLAAERLAWSHLPLSWREWDYESRVLQTHLWRPRTVGEIAADEERRYLLGLLKQ